MSSLTTTIKIENDGNQSDRESLLSRKKVLEKRLIEINGPSLNHKNEWKFIKTETHWDSLLQELVIIPPLLLSYDCIDMARQ